MTQAVLTTERLVLRQIGEGDLDPHMTLLNTPAVMQHLGGVQPRAVIAAKHAASRAGFAAEGYGFMIMEERASGEMVGHCGLRHVAHPLAPNPADHEIGWLVREDRWRMGYAHEAMRAVVDWGFAVHAAPHLVAAGPGRGRIVAISESRVDVVEIVADGAGAWQERPRTLSLKKHS
mgnify:CR=1 FL=1